MSELKKQLSKDLNPGLSREEKRANEIDEISEKYGFPVSLIEMYGMSLVSDNRLFIQDGVSSLNIPTKESCITEILDGWQFTKLAKFTIILSKQTRELIISIL